MGSAALLEAGIYSVPDAARLLQIPSQKVRGWIFGYPNTQGAPILPSELRQVDGEKALSFVNLIEARFVNFFALHGVSVKSLRTMAKEAIRVLNDPHPFATNTIFRTDGKKVFVVAMEETGDPKLYDLKGKNWAFYDILVEALQQGITFREDGYAELWQPRARCPNVIIHPRIAFGQPVLRDSGVPTRALADAFSAEGETYESVAHWYDVPLEQVKEAIRFEKVEMLQAA